MDNGLDATDLERLRELLARAVGRPDPFLFLPVFKAPPPGLYVTVNHLIRVKVWNSVPTFQVRLTYDLLQPDNQLLKAQHDLTPTSDRLVNVFEFTLAEGILTAVAINPLVTDARRGQCFVEVEVHTETQPAPVSKGFPLIADYVTSNYHLGWPAGRLRAQVEGIGSVRSITGTLPAAGVNISETVPVNARWQLLAMTFGFTTSAVVANRQVAILIDDGVNTLYLLDSESTQAASLAHRYNVAPLGFSRPVSNARHVIPLPMDVDLFQGFRLRTSVTALDPGDQFTAPQLWVRELIED